MLTCQKHAQRRWPSRTSRHRSSLTCPSDAAAAPLTLSRAEAMPHHTAVLCLLLMTGTLAAMGAGEDKYRREDGTFTNTPSATVPAASDTACAISCTSKEPWSCGGFTYHSGTCGLYRAEATGVDPLEAAPPLETNTGSQPRSYRRLQSTDPGEVILF